MKQELVNKLYEKYPKIFFEDADKKKPTLDWGFEHGDGWYDILDDLCSKIQKICDSDGHQIVAVQVKEKYGALRFYINGGSQEIYNLIDEAEHKSEKTCEVCGEPGKIYRDGWWYSACDKHTKK